MFEGFSFEPASSRPARKNNSLSLDREDDLTLQCDSSFISPLSSRCPSPGLLSPSATDFPQFHSRRRSRSQFPAPVGPAPTSIPQSYVEQQQQQQHRLSIGSLTHRLNAQSLENNPRRNSRCSPDPDGENACLTTPPRSSTGTDQDLHMSTAADTPTITTTAWPDSCAVEPPTPPDTDRDDSPTLSPRFSSRRSSSFPSLSLRQSLSSVQESHTPSTPRSSPDIRHQRETLSILQSTASSVAETVRLAVLLHDRDNRFDDGLVDNDHHPSSLPPTRISRRHQQPQQHVPSSSSTPRICPPKKSRVDKPRNTSHGSSHNSSSSNNNNNNNTSVFSGQGLGLRRRSLVLAAVSAVLEAEAETTNKQGRAASSSALLSPRSSPDAQPQPQRRRRSQFSPARSRRG